MKRARLLAGLVSAAMLVGCAASASPSGPTGPVSASPSSGSSAPAASTAATAATSSGDPTCAAVGRLRAALAAFKALDPASAPLASLRTKAHDIGQAGVDLIVLKAGAADLTKLNHEVLLVVGVMDAGQTPLPQDITEFEATTQKVLDELAACP